MGSLTMFTCCTSCFNPLGLKSSDKGKIIINLSNLTIIIPSFNRQAFLKRQLAFWRDTKATILILDGTHESLLDTQWPEKNIRYIHMPVSIEKRLAFASDIIDTEYAAMLSDDELFIPSALEDCLGFLESNPSYAACKGQVLGFRRNSFISRCQGVIDYTNLRGYEVASSVPGQRLLQHMSPYAMASLWAVHRSEILKKALKLAGLRPPYSCAAAFEVQISLVTAWFGKVKVLDQLMWLRSRENRNIWWAFGNVPTFDWLTGNKYRNEVEQFKNDFAFICNEDHARSAIIEGVRKALAEYTSAGLIARRNKSLFSSCYGRFFDFFWYIIGERLRSVFREIFNKNHTLMAEAGELSKSGVVVDFDELNRIDLFLINFKVDSLIK